MSDFASFSGSQHMPLPVLTALPYPVCFRHQHIPADAVFDLHQHPWGQLNYLAQGVMQLEIAGQQFLSPPDYAVWIPPQAPHRSYNRHAVVYRSVYFDQSVCAGMPPQPHTLSLDPLLKAILADFAERNIDVPHTAADRRLADVLVDRVLAAPLHTSYLPFSEHPQLSPMLQALQDNPADPRAVSDWAATAHTTERTLARLCQRELGMSLGEWRQRARFVRALEWLEQGLPIKHIALDLGYSTPSAFISMFQRQAGMSPEQYRKRLRG